MDNKDTAEKNDVKFVLKKVDKEAAKKILAILEKEGVIMGCITWRCKSKWHGHGIPY